MGNLAATIAGRLWRLSGICKTKKTTGRHADESVTPATRNSNWKVTPKRIPAFPQSPQITPTGYPGPRCSPFLSAGEAFLSLRHHGQVCPSPRTQSRGEHARRVAAAGEAVGLGLRRRYAARHPDHPHRDARFRHIDRAVKRVLRAGEPVISVDTLRRHGPVFW